jgi:hypothetical protein
VRGGYCARVTRVGFIGVGRMGLPMCANGVLEAPVGGGVPEARAGTLHQGALTRYGPVDRELLAVALLEEQAGIQLRHGIGEGC